MNSKNRLEYPAGFRTPSTTCDDITRDPCALKSGVKSMLTLDLSAIKDQRSLITHASQLKHVASELMPHACGYWSNYQSYLANISNNMYEEPHYINNVFECMLKHGRTHTTKTGKSYSDKAGVIIISTEKVPTDILFDNCIQPTAASQFESVSGYNWDMSIHPTMQSREGSAGSACASSDNLTSDNAVIKKIRDNIKVLMVQQVESGLWGFPKGSIGEHEQAIEGAKRELKEETGIDISKEDLSAHPSLYIRKKYHSYFTVIVDKNIPIKVRDNSLSENEIKGIHWVRLSDALRNRIRHSDGFFGIKTSKFTMHSLEDINSRINIICKHVIEMRSTACQN